MYLYSWFCKKLLYQTSNLCSQNWPTSFTEPYLLECAKKEASYKMGFICPEACWETLGNFWEDKVKVAAKSYFFDEECERQYGLEGHRKCRWCAGVGLSGLN